MASSFVPVNSDTSSSPYTTSTANHVASSPSTPDVQQPSNLATVVPHGLLNSNGSAQVSTAPPTPPSATSSSITPASHPALVNGIYSTINPATQPTTPLPEISPSFLTNEFMQSVASTLDDFDAQALFRPEDTTLNFEQDFREWFGSDLENGC